MKEEDISAYEGLVVKTAQMFAELVGLEMDDMKQELRLKILKVRRSYKPDRSRISERAYVYGCMANFVKDLKRDRARRAGRLHFTYIEGFGLAGVADMFEYRHTSASHDETYGAVEEGTFTLPATVTETEREIIYLLVIGYAQTEIAATLRLEYNEVVKQMRILRVKLADWRPTREAEILPEAIPAPTAIAA